MKRKNGPIVFQSLPDGDEAQPEDLCFPATLTLSPDEVVELLPLELVVQRCMFDGPVAFMQEVIKDAGQAPNASGENNFPRADAKRMLELVDAFRAALENSAQYGFLQDETAGLTPRDGSDH